MTKKTTTDNAVEAGQPKAPTKLALLLGQLGRADGASIVELTAATGWQAHSVRGAIAGTLKKKGHATTSDVVDGVRRYRLAGAAQ
jgi:hypothetical protein